MEALSLIGNFMAQKKQNDYINQQLKYQKNPQLAQNEITGLTQPLNANLVSAITNQTQSWLGQQGLAESPNIMASVLAQALGPYEQQNQQTAINEWLGLHNLPIQFPQQTDLSGYFTANMLPFLNQGGNQQNPLAGLVLT